MHKLIVTISGTLYDHHGNLIRKIRPRAAHSFLAQFIELLMVQFSQTAQSITDTGNVERSCLPSSISFKVEAGASTLTHGILIGSGTTPPDIDDYVLETPISADLTVSVHTLALSYPVAGTRRLSISRTFSNAALSPMAIEEVALYTIIPPGWTGCMDRTLYSISIPASSSLELTYRIDVSV